MSNILGSLEKDLFATRGSAEGANALWAAAVRFASGKSLAVSWILLLSSNIELGNKVAGFLMAPGLEQLQIYLLRLLDALEKL